MKKGLFIMIFSVMTASLCGCGAEQVFYRTDEGLYAYEDQLYKNDGEILLSKAELEYAELIWEFPEGVQDAEWYTELYRYGDWLLLGIDDSRSLQGLEGYRYFLLIPEEDRGRTEYEMADGMSAAICYDGAIYQYESDEISEETLDNMEAVGMVQSLDEAWPKEDLQANSPELLGHLVYECGGKLLTCRNGEVYEAYVLME
ncbi:MAG: hypothetical protein NC420_10630 [Eubacterium sp.]|nr:hypothetical protein [Eubacterium sp.]MCM1304999.1 hypothetical protein [Butyrivibrio sp.]MCM1344332.1 hypothetical protein [Muribaculaceae bacterium]MCM1409026.1 hypothetical protein [Lachnospiraceae bacterium]